MSVNEIRAVLINRFGKSPDEVNTLKGKKEASAALYRAIDEEVGDAQETPGFFANIVVEKPKLGDAKQEESSETEIKRISLGSPEWEDYVLSHLTPSEYEEKDGKKYPKTNGLRRVAQLLLGAIISSGPVQVFPSTAVDGAGRATVVYEVQIEWKNDVREYYTEDEIRNYRPEVRTFRAVADCWHGNTPAMFAVHAVATAETKAEGRALRKALALNLNTAEEMSNDKDPNEFVEKPNLRKTDGEWDGEEKAQTNQIIAITNICARLDIDITKFIEYMFPGKDVNTLTKGQGAKLMLTLNKYQVKDNTHIDIPEEVKKG